MVAATFRNLLVRCTRQRRLLTSSAVGDGSHLLERRSWDAEENGLLIQRGEKPIPLTGNKAACLHSAGHWKAFCTCPGASFSHSRARF